MRLWLVEYSHRREPRQAGVNFLGPGAASPAVMDTLTRLSGETVVAGTPIEVDDESGTAMTVVPFVLDPDDKFIDGVIAPERSMPPYPAREPGESPRDYASRLGRAGDALRSHALRSGVLPESLLWLMGFRSGLAATDGFREQWLASDVSAELRERNVDLKFTELSEAIRYHFVEETDPVPVVADEPVRQGPELFRIFLGDPAMADEDDFDPVDRSALDPADQVEIERVGPVAWATETGHAVPWRARPKQIESYHHLISQDVYDELRRLSPEAVLSLAIVDLVDPDGGVHPYVHYQFGRGGAPWLGPIQLDESVPPIVLPTGKPAELISEFGSRRAARERTDLALRLDDFGPTAIMTFVHFGTVVREEFVTAWQATKISQRLQADPAEDDLFFTTDVPNDQVFHSYHWA